MSWLLEVTTMGTNSHITYYASKDSDHAISMQTTRFLPCSPISRHRLDVWCHYTACNHYLVKCGLAGRSEVSKYRFTTRVCHVVVMVAKNHGRRLRKRDAFDFDRCRRVMASTAQWTPQTSI